MPILYFTSWYNEKNPERKAELVQCIVNTLACDSIDCLYILCEADLDLQHSKLIKIPFGKRATYSDFFEYANTVSKPGDINIFSNIDIYPDQGTLVHLEKLQAKDSYALARWDKKPDGSTILLDRWDAQDIWAFRSPIKKVNANFTMGIPGCDNRIAYELMLAGYIVSNPSKTIRFFHLHNIQIHNYTLDRKDAVPGPYHLVNTSE